MIDWQDYIWLTIWFSTGTGASCSQASLGEPSAVVTSGMRPAVTAPHLVWGKHSVDRISSVERQVSSMPIQQQLRLSNIACKVSWLKCSLLTVGGLGKGPEICILSKLVTHEIFFKSTYFIFKIICIKKGSMCMCECRCPYRTEEGTRSSGVGIIAYVIWATTWYGCSELKCRTYARAFLTF